MPWWDPLKAVPVAVRSRPSCSRGERALAQLEVLELGSDPEAATPVQNPHGLPQALKTGRVGHRGVVRVSGTHAEGGGTFVERNLSADGTGPPVMPFGEGRACAFKKHLATDVAKEICLPLAIPVTGIGICWHRRARGRGPLGSLGQEPFPVST